MTSPQGEDAEASRPGAPPPAPRSVDDETFPPTLREVMLRPQWIGLLLLCLVVAGVFAWLGQWQLSRAIDIDPPPPGATEQVRPIAEVAAPGAYLPEPLVGQRVMTVGWWVPGDFLIVQSRFNDGVEGYWVTGQLRLEQTAEPTSLAVAIAWAPTLEAAETAAASMEARIEGGGRSDSPMLTGRLISDEGPALPPDGADPQTMTRMSPAALLGRWHATEGVAVYRPYLVADDPAGAMELEPFPGTQAISSPAPAEGSAVNWLNVFYAAEWAIFGGFAFYLWYRLARDAWEKELEDLADAAAPAS